jgi:GAF domain-containing protein
MSATPDSTFTDPEQRVADLERQLVEREAELAECKAERDEALEQQTATAEVLGVINASPGDLAPVFDVMLEKALRLCEVDIGTLWLYDGKMVRAAAVRGAPPQLAEFLAKGPYQPAKPQLLVLSGAEEVVQIADITATQAYREGDPIPRAIADLGGVHTLLIVPLRKDNAVLGNFAIYRREPRPFTNKQIALLQNFAVQAVIAMENARLITETHEALEQQTATAEVLQVINSSPGDLTPVFDAMLEKAVRLCNGVNGILWTFEGKRARLAASRNMSPPIVEQLRQQGESGCHPMVQRVISGDHLFQFDLSEHDTYRSRVVTAATDLIASGVRTVIWVALVKDGTSVGTFVISRQEVQPFSDKQIALLQNFAEQAVIAMENARLLTETREALEQQTATAEVLGVINSSPGDLAPVFDAMLERALRLCGAAFGNLLTYDGERFHAAAVRGVSEFAELSWLRRAFRPPPGGALDRVVRGESPVHIHDLEADIAYGPSSAPEARELVVVGKYRTLLTAALRKDDALLGVMTVYRQEMRPFSDKQIACCRILRRRRSSRWRTRG